MVEAWAELHVTELLVDWDRLQEGRSPAPIEPVLAGELYGPLRDLELFNQVRVDPEVETLVWPNGADFDPATLYEWPSNGRAFRELARRWEAVQA